MHDLGRRKGVCHKLTNNWKGPYIVTRKIDELTYLVKCGAKQMSKAYHIDRLLPYKGKHNQHGIKNSAQHYVNEDRSSIVMMNCIYVT